MYKSGFQSKVTWYLATWIDNSRNVINDVVAMLSILMGVIRDMTGQQVCSLIALYVTDNLHL